MIEQLKSLILKRQTLNDNKCGSSIIELQNEMNMTADEINPLFRQLYDEKFITVRKGINIPLVFLHQNQPNKTRNDT